MRNHIASPQGLRSLLQRELPYQDFVAAAIPLYLVCADLVTGDEVVLSSGDITKAVLASTAIPGVFPPVEHDGRFLVDGAVTSGTPISVAVAHGATRIIVLPCGFACAQKVVARGAVGRALHAISILGASQLRRDFDHYSTSRQIHIAPPLCPMTQSSFDYSNGNALIARGRASTRTWIEAGGLGRGEFPQQLSIHSH
jgi:NTE family protein